MDGISPRQPQNPQSDSDNFFRHIDPQQPAYPAPSASQYPSPSPSFNPSIPSQPPSHVPPAPAADPFQPSFQPRVDSYQPQVETTPAANHPQPYATSDIEPEPSVQSFDHAQSYIPQPPSAEPVLPPDTIVPQPQRTEDEKVSYAEVQIQEIDITKIVANPFQPRKFFRPEALQELADSIREHGVIQPIVVTETPNGYEIVVGERRFRASQLAGMAKIPAMVKKTLHDQTKLEVALIENIQRQELNAIEEAQAYDRLIKTFNMTQDQVAKKVGKSRPAITNTLRLLNLPAEIQRGVVEGKISEGHARAILGLPDIEKQILMFQAIQEQGLNVRQVEAKVREIAVKRKMDAAMPDPKLMAIESELRGKLGAQVKIQRQGRGGKITIEFFSDEDLDEILNRMEEHKANQGGNNYLVV